MKKGKRLYSKLAAAVITMILILACAASVSAADNTSVSNALNLTLGKKTTISFSSGFANKYYKVSIPKKGAYRMYIYSDTDDSNECFWVGIYGSASDAKKGDGLIWSESGLYNYTNSDPDYEYYKLNKGTYYICTQGWKKNHRTMAIKLEYAADTFDTWLSELYTSEEQGIWVSDLNDKEAKLTDVTISDKTVAKLIKDTWKDGGKTQKSFRIVGKKAGKATVTIKYTTPKGKKCTLKKKLTVKTYPNEIQSLKINGKKVDVSKNKFEYNEGDLSSTKVKVNLKLKKGWKIQSADANVWNMNTGSSKELSGVKTSLKKGSAISWPKKYTEFEIVIHMRKGDEFIDYQIRLSRGEV